MKLPAAYTPSPLAQTGMTETYIITKTVAPLAQTGFA